MGSCLTALPYRIEVHPWFNLQKALELTVEKKKFFSYIFSINPIQNCFETYYHYLWCL